MFARAERTDNNELLAAAGVHGEPHTVAKISVGALRDFPVASHATLGVGALFAINSVDEALEPVYGANPTGGMVFVRLRIE